LSIDTKTAAEITPDTRTKEDMMEVSTTQSLFIFQGEGSRDIGLDGESLTIYELFVIICERLQGKVDSVPGVSGPSSPIKKKKGYVPRAALLRGSPNLLKYLSAAAEVTRQYLSYFLNERVIFIPHKGALYPHIGNTDVHAVGMAFDHGDGIKGSAAPTFFFLERKKALSNSQVYAALALLKEKGILPAGGLGLYENINTGNYAYDNLHYDYRGFAKNNKNLFPWDEIKQAAYPLAWLWYPKKKDKTAYGHKAKSGSKKKFSMTFYPLDDKYHPLKIPQPGGKAMVDMIQVGAGNNPNAKKIQDYYQSWENKLSTATDTPALPSIHDYINFLNSAPINSFVALKKDPPQTIVQSRSIAQLTNAEEGGP